MEHVLAAITAALDWVNAPMNKTVLMVLGSWVWNRHEATINKALPALTMGASILTGAAQLVMASIAAAFPQAGIHSAAYEAAAHGSVVSTVGAAVFGTVVPVLVTIGHHSWLKNLAEWLADGAKLLKRK